jgi:hypothetical protein
MPRGATFTGLLEPCSTLRSFYAAEEQRGAGH